MLCHASYTSWKLYPEEHVPNLVDDLWITACLSAWKALESGEHEIRGIFEVERGLYAFEIIGWRRCVCAIFDGHTPLAAPFTVNLYPKDDIQALDRFLIDGILHNHKHKWHKHASRAFIQFPLLVTKPPLHIPCMDAVIHHMESGIKECWERPHIGMGNHEAAPLFGCQGIKDSQHLIRISLETSNGFFTRQAAKRLSILIELFSHNRQAECASRFTLASKVPARKIAFGHIDHMTINIAYFPLGTASLYVPIFRVINDIEEFRTLSTNYIDYSILATIIHRVDYHSKPP